MRGMCNACGRPTDLSLVQTLYTEAFERWLRSNSPRDREEMTVLLRIARREKAGWLPARRRETQGAGNARS